LISLPKSSIAQALYSNSMLSLSNCQDIIRSSVAIGPSFHFKSQFVTEDG